MKRLQKNLCDEIKPRVGCTVIAFPHFRYILNGLAKEVDMTKTEIDEMIADIDEDGNGEVSFEGW